MERTFTPAEARNFYDRFGAKQDRQGFYEDAALDQLIRHGRFRHAQSVLEIGCGTGRLAAHLLSDHLPTTAHFTGIDVSSTMVDLAREKLAPWAERTVVRLSDGDFDSSSRDCIPFDRIVSTYVFDLLSIAQIDAALAAAHRSIQIGGLLCVAGLTKGTDFFSTATSKLWTLAHKVRPTLVGGCRPLVLADMIPLNHWRIVHRSVVVSSSVPSEVLVVEAI